MTTRFSIGRVSTSDCANFAVIVVNGGTYSLSELSADTFTSIPHDGLRGMLADWDRYLPLLHDFARRVADGIAAVSAIDVSTIRYHAPIARPGKLLCSAANYREHVAEMAAYNVAAGADPSKRFAGDKTNAEPYLFLKASSAVAGPYDEIILPHGMHNIDWEAELAVVIGRTARRVSAERALEYVAGYMTMNDVTCRDMLWRADRPNFKTDWLGSKSHDGFAPMGPLFMPADFVRDPNRLRVTLAVNGVTKQDGNTSEMIFSAQEQVAFASRFMTLEPGDVFATGTIGGVGQATGEFLKAGDVMETWVEEVWMLRNRIVAPNPDVS